MPAGCLVTVTTFRGSMRSVILFQFQSECSYSGVCSSHRLSQESLFYCYNPYMHPNIRLLKTVLDELSITYKTIQSFPDGICVRGTYFIHGATPFNDEAISLLCRDKDAVHKVLAGLVAMPRTKSFLNPEGRYSTLAEAKSVADIPSLTLDFVYPRIVKMNRGEQGRNVFLVESDAEMNLALREIFDQTSRHYDYIALVQEYIKPRREVRVLVSAGKAGFFYDRNSKKEITGADVSKLQAMCEIVLQNIPLSWGACDFIQSDVGEWYFLEINTRPELSEHAISEYRIELKNLYRKAIVAFLST